MPIITCSACRGSGYYIEYGGTGVPDSSKYMETCRQCNGEGFIAFKESTQECKKTDNKARAKLTFGINLSCPYCGKDIETNLLRFEGNYFGEIVK